MRHSCPEVRRITNCDRSGRPRELPELGPATRDETALLQGKTPATLWGHADSQERAAFDEECDRKKEFRLAGRILRACCNKQVRRCSICDYSLRKHFTQDARLAPVRARRDKRQETRGAKGARTKRTEHFPYIIFHFSFCHLHLRR